jgi:hypothetical protein
MPYPSMTIYIHEHEKAPTLNIREKCGREEDTYYLEAVE